MKVKDIIKLAKIRLQNIRLSSDEEAMILLINMGVNELYNRFNLSIKSETITTSSDLALYELRNDDVQLILSVFDKFGTELRQSDVLDGVEYDYKIVNYRSFLLRRPFTGYLYAVYKASPVVLKDLEDAIDLPDIMMNVLLTYVAYMGHNTINKDDQHEMINQFQAFTQMCQDLELQGYKIPLNTETVAIQARGFV